MIDRQLLGDLLLAALVAVPAAALARPEVARNHASQSVAAQKSTLALASAADRQIGLFR